MLIGAASPDPAALLRAQQSAEREAARLAQASESATTSAAKARTLAAELNAQIAASRGAVASSRARLVAVDTQSRALAAQLAEQRQPIAQLVAAVVALQRRPAALALVQPASLDAQAHVRASLRALVPTIEVRTAELRAQVALVARSRNAALAERATLGRAEAQLVAQQAALGRYAGSRLRVAEDAAGRGLMAQDRALALADDAARLQRVLDEAKIDGATASRLGTLPRLATLPGAPQASPPYRVPTGALVTGFGERLDDGRRSAALILSPPPSSPVGAPRGGRIAFAGPLKGYGQVVIVEHGAGWTSVIAGLADVAVTRGDQVAIGAPLGRTTSTNPAIRLELRHNGAPVAPTRLAG